MSEGRGIQLPGRPQAARGVPENANIISFEGQFDGLNTKSPRIAIKPSECAWLDGFMPVTDTSLRTLYGPGASVFNAAGVGSSIAYFSQFNLGSTAYFFVLLANGSAYQVNPLTSVVIGIAGPGVFPGSAIDIDIASWGSQYLIIVCNSAPNGYFIWDGSNLFEAGTIGPAVNITSGGFGYTSAPAVTMFSPSGSGGTGFSATVENGAVNKVSVVFAGSGFSISSIGIAVFSGGGNGTATAYGTCSVANGVITNVTLTDPGSGYQSSNGVQQPPTVSITDPTGSGANIVVSEMSGGQIVSLKVTAGGQNYSNPGLSFTGGGGSGAAATAEWQNGVVIAVSTVSSGMGYNGDVTVNFLSPTGTGAQATALLSSIGSLENITITNGGSGYTVSDTIFYLTGPGPAAATIGFMPFGINGTAVETFQGRVWIGNGAAGSFQNRVIFSSAGDPSDFNPANGSGAFLSTDTFLRTGYFGLRQVNGFLYLIGDSSENTISGVQTSAPSSATSSVITTFNNQNADPQLGTPWPSSIQVFSRNLVFANRYGIMISYGGAVTKISQALDGFYNVNPTLPQLDYSSATAQIFGNLVYLLLIPVFDPIANAVVNKLVMWDGKKFWTHPAPTYIYIATLEIDSQITAWATDGNELVQLFAVPTTGFAKIIRTKLWADPSYWETKTAIRLSGVLEVHNSTGTSSIMIDSEAGSTAPYGVTPVGTSPDFFGSPLPVGQQGRCLGMTFTTFSEDMEVVSLSMLTQIETSNL